MRTILRTVRMLRPVFLLMCIATSTQVRSQEINITSVPAAICAGATLNFQFSVTNGTGTVNHFTPSTVYEVFLSDETGNNFVSAGTFSVNATYDGSDGGVTPGLAGSIALSTGLAGGSNYLIAVNSVNPSYDAVINNSFSAPITINPVVVPSVSISASPSASFCSGASVTFTATPVNGGSNPQVEWFVNGISAGSGLTYTSNTLANGNQVTAVLTSNDCADPVTVTSNLITVTVNATVVPTVSIWADNTTICAGETITFNADGILNGGLNPTYQWLVNGMTAGTNSPVFSSSTLANNDIVTLEFTSSAVCAIPATITSNPVQVTVNPLLPVSVSVNASSTNICQGTSVTFTATGVNGGSNPVYQWTVNGLNVGTNSNTYSTSALNNNDVVVVTLTSDATPCASGSPATSTGIVMTVNPVLTVSVSITASSTNICSGQPVTFNAVPVNGGSNPGYQWKVNGSDVPGEVGVSFTTNSLANGDIVTVQLTSGIVNCITSNPSTSNAITITVNPVVAAGVSIVASQSTICSGASVTFSATPVNGGSASYQWQVNGSNAGVNSNTFTTAALVDGDQVSVIMTSGLTCVSGSPVTSNMVTMNVDPSQPVSVSVNASSTNICEGTTVTFTANVTNGGNASYQWKINGVNAGTNSSTFTTSTLANNDIVTVTVNSDVSCATNNPATSAGIQVTVNPVLPVSVTIAASSSNICAGSSVTFTATPVNGGTPTYAWFVNGNPAGTNSSTFTTSSLNNGDQVHVVMTSSIVACTSGSPATSNSITVTVNPLLAAGVSISTASNIICAGSSVTFNATPVNGGTTPSYQWKVNGVNVGTNSSSYTTTTLNNNDVVTVVMTSNATCATGSPATSNALTMTVNPLLPVSVSISASSANICAGNSVTFTATPVNGGTTPSYQWLLNNNPVGTNSATFTSTTLANGDVVKVVLTSNITPCATGNPATSNTITMNVAPLVTPSVSITASSTSICSGTGVTFTATPVNGGAAPTYQWKIGAANYGAPTTSNTVTITTLTNGQSVSVVMTSNAACASPATATSNSIAITVWTGDPNNTGGPAANRRITGPASICPGPAATGLVYNAPVNLTNTQTYTWSVPPGFTITSGQSTSSITVSVPGPGAIPGNNTISLVPSNPCGSIAAITFTVNITSFNAVNAGPDFTLCSGSTATLTNTLTGGAQRVHWSVPVGTIGGGPYPTAFTYTPPANYSGTVTLTARTDTAAGSCNPAASFGTDQVVVTVREQVTITSQPASQTVCSGSNVLFSVTATGSGLTYQWRKGTTPLTNGGNISGATTATLNLANVAPGDAGNYNVIVSGMSPCAAVTSSNAVLTVNQAVAITTQPSSMQTVCSGTTVNISVSATGTGLTYQWRKGSTPLVNGGNISGVTSATLQISNISLADAAPDYNVVITGTAPCTGLTSNNAAIVVNDAVTITSQPVATQTVCSGSTVSFSVTATGSGLAYQWRKGVTLLSNGGNISGVNTSILVLTNVSLADNGNYNVVVSGIAPCSAVTSSNSLLTVNQAVSITSQPVTTSVCAGNTATFTVAANGTGLTYQWRRGTNPLVDGGNISGATTSTLSINNASPADAGNDYNVVVSGTAPCNDVTSVNVSLNVNEGAVITAQPVAVTTVCSGTNVILNVTATGTGITYQWRKGSTPLSDGASISGALTATLTLSNTTSATSGNYNVIVYGAPGCPQVISADATVTVNDAVNIIAQPQASQTVCSGTTVQLLVSANGSGLTYQWRRGVTPLADGGNISGATTSTLTITNATTSDAGNDYNVVISGQSPCSPVTSSNAAIIINEGVQLTSQPAATIIECSGGTAVFSVSASGTGLTYQWRKGTTPLVNGGNISGANTATLTISGLAVADAGSYNVVISGLAPCAPVTSANSVLTVNQAVVITTQPAVTQTVCSETSVSFTVAATGTGLTYQWRKGSTPLVNGGNISGANSATLTINPVTTGDAGSDYNVVVSGTSPCAPVTSNNSALVVNEKVTITAQPQPVVTCSGNTITLSVTATGTGLTYRWRKGTTLLNDAGNISGAFTSTLTISNIALSDAAANYNVVVTGTAPCSPATSVNVAVVVNKKVTITTQPVNVGVCASNPASFGVVADGTSLTYQWYKGTFPGTPVSNTATISGAQSNILNFSQAALSDAGIYYVMVSGASPCAPVKSNEVTLNVDQSITISVNPVSQTICTGQPVIFSVTATAGGATLTYQWRRNGSNIPGASASSYTIPSVTGANAGNYDVVISGPSGFTCPSITSLPATLTVQSHSTITLTSAAATTNQVVCSGSPITNITYSIGGGGTGAAITAGSLPAGVTGNFSGGTFTISGTPSVAGVFNYTVTTTGPCNNVSLSGTITVNAHGSLTLTSAPATTSQVICINNAITSISYTIGGGATGAALTAGSLPAGVSGSFSAGVYTISGIPTVGGVYNYTVSTTGPCNNVSLSGTITVQANSTISLTSAAATANQDVCINTSITNITYSVGGGATGAAITAGGLPSGVTGIFNAGVFTISGTPTVAGTYNYTVSTTGPCVNQSLSGTITVRANSTLTLSSAAATTSQNICINTALANITYNVGGGATGAIISAGALPAGVTGTFNAGVFTISGTPTVAGTFNYTVSTTGPCVNTSLSGSMIVRPNSTLVLTSAVSTSSQQVCINTAITNIVYTAGSGATGVVISAGALPAGVNGSYNAGVYTISGTPTVAGVFNYTLTTTGTCQNASLSGTITVSGSSVGGTLSPNVQTICYGSNSGTITLSGHTGSVIRWEYSNNGGSTWTTIANTSTTFNYSNLTQPTLYRAVIQSGSCGIAYSSYAVLVAAQPFNPTISASALTVCVNQPITLTASDYTSLGVLAYGNFDIANPPGWSGSNASSNNGDPNSGWGLSNGGTYNGVYYNSITKFMIITGTGGTGPYNLSSPTFSTVGLSNAYLVFNHAMNLNAGATATIQISLDGGATYTTLQTYTGPLNVGPTNGLSPTVAISLNNYLGMTNLKVRFVYSGNVGSNWAIDNINISTTTSAPGSTIYDPLNYAWSPGTYLSSTTGQVVTFTSATPGTYTVNVSTTTSQGCAGGSAGTITVTVRPEATLSAASQGSVVCSGSSAVISLTGLLPSSNSVITYTIGGGPAQTANVTSDASGAGSFNVPVTTVNNGQQLLITQVSSQTGGSGPSCAKAFSIGTTLFVSEPASVASQPFTSTVCSGTSASFTMSAAGSSTSLQWQVSTNGGTTWTNISGAPYTGFNSNSLVVNNPTPIMATYLYRTVVTSSAPCNSLVQTVATPLKLKNVWIGNVSNDWNNGANWSDGTVPDNTCSDVYILGSRPFQPVLGSGMSTIHNLVMLGGLPTVNGSGVLRIAGTISGGSINVVDGTIDFNGSGPQALGPNTFVSKSIKNLTVTTNLFTLNDSLFLFGELKMNGTGKTHATNDLLTLRSTATATANVAQIAVDGSGNALSFITGRVTVERFIPATRAWRYLSIPTNTTQSIRQSWQENQPTNSTALSGYGIHITSNRSTWLADGFDLHTPAGPSMKMYNSVTNGYDGVTSTFNPIKTDRGYMVIIRGDRTVNQFNQPSTTTVLRTRGTLYTGKQPAINAAADQFTSVGNPYASAIDFSQVQRTGGVQDVFYVWDPKLNGQGLGAFQTFVGMGGGSYFVTPGGGSYAGGNTFIESGQAFLVRAQGTAGTVTISENAKVSGSNMVYRPMSAVPQIKIDLHAVNAEATTLVDGVLLQIDPSFNRNIDELDAQKLSNNNETMSMTWLGKNLVVERRDRLHPNDTIHLKTERLQAKPYKMEITAQEATAPGLQAFLEDRFTGTHTPVSLEGSTLYEFTVSSNAASYSPTRFRIVFRRKGNAMQLPTTKVDAQRNIDNSVAVEWKVENGEEIVKNEIERSSDGKNFSPVQTKQHNSNRLNDDAGNDQYYYRLRSVMKNGDVIYSNVAKVNAVESQAEIMVYPNPVINHIMKLHYSGLKKGTFTVMLVSTGGQEVFKKAVSLDEAGSTAIPIPQSITKGTYYLKIVGNGFSQSQRLQF